MDDFDEALEISKFILNNAFKSNLEKDNYFN